MALFPTIFRVSTHMLFFVFFALHLQKEDAVLFPTFFRVSTRIVFFNTPPAVTLSIHAHSICFYFFQIFNAPPAVTLCLWVCVYTVFLIIIYTYTYTCNCLQSPLGPIQNTFYREDILYRNWLPFSKAFLHSHRPSSNTYIQKIL